MKGLLSYSTSGFAFWQHFDGSRSQRGAKRANRENHILAFSVGAGYHLFVHGRPQRIPQYFEMTTPDVACHALSLWRIFYGDVLSILGRFSRRK